jgi:monofunctional biosynthetic peptidoglycan transglycosylase
LVGRLLAAILVLGAALPLGVVVLYRLVPPPVTPLMVLRAGGYQSTPRLPPPQSWTYAWVPLSEIAATLPRAVIAAEDTGFCSHDGFDEKAFTQAWENYRSGIRARGGSTISQQAAKNAFLWPGRSVVRKGLETALTPALEAFWGKRRIMEVYLNIVEWAPGVYGAEAAARHHFNKSAAALSPREAALLAAVLPSPRRWSASRPGPYVSGRAGTIMARMAQVAANCVAP